MNVAITAAEEQLPIARALGNRYGLPVVATDSDEYPFCLVVTAQHIECRVPDQLKPLVIDFAAGKAKFRQHCAQMLQHPLVRAVGVKRNEPPSVIDVTAGMGDDAYLLASLGCKVLMLERHPVIAILLEDALTRLKTSQPEIELSLRYVDAKTYLQSGVKADVIICDPMFPKGGQRAKVKKPMQLLQALVGSDRDADEVFGLALQVAQKRVVVKRPKTAPPLAEKAPTFSIRTKNHRFDGYEVT